MHLFIYLICLKNPYKILLFSLEVPLLCYCLLFYACLKIIFADFMYTFQKAVLSTDFSFTFFSFWETGLYQQHAAWLHHQQGTKLWSYQL